MKLSIAKNDLLRPLNRVIGAVERRNTLPVLGTVLFQLNQGLLELTTTDTEIELKDSVQVDADFDFEWTLPARKLFDILRSLPDDATVNISLAETKATVQAGRAKFTLSMLSAADFPKTDSVGASTRFDIIQEDLKRLFSRVDFSMAQQDVRYYLNGLLLEIEGDVLAAVSTDGHRLSYAKHQLPAMVAEAKQVIIPNKGVRELIRLMDDPSASAQISLSDQHIQMRSGSLCFTSKLIDGKFPDYRRVMPLDNDRIGTVDRNELLAALNRVQILSNEKFNGVRLQFAGDQLSVQANNPEQEQAEDAVELNYSGEALEIGFNIRYIIDVLKVIQSDTVEFKLGDSNASVLVLPPGADDVKFVVMPIRL